MQNVNGTTQEFGAPVNGGFNGGFNGGGQGGNNGQRKSYPTPCSIQSRPQNTNPEFLYAALVGRIFQPKIEMRQNTEGQMVKVFSCNLMTVKNASTFNYHFGPYGADGQIMNVFPVDQEVIYVTVSVWDSPKRLIVSNYIEKLNLKDKDQIFVGGRLKCTTSQNPQHAGRYFLNLSAKDFTLISRSQANSQGEGQGNGYTGTQNGGYNASKGFNGNTNPYGGQPNQAQGFNGNTNPYGGQPNQAQGFNGNTNPYGGQPTQNQGFDGNANPYGGQPNQGAMPTPPAFNQGNPYGENPGFQNPGVETINISDDDLPF